MSGDETMSAEEQTMWRIVRILNGFEIPVSEMHADAIHEVLRAYAAAVAKAEQSAEGGR